MLEYNATVTEKEILGDHLFLLRIQPDADDFPFVPGQYATLGLFAKEARASHATDEPEQRDPDYLIRRAYSIASSPSSSNLEFYLAMVQNGALTPRLFALEKGSRIFISKKAVGRFTLEQVAPPKSLLLLSTGTGLAPYMSMLRNNFAWTPDRHVIIMHGVRHAEDLGYQEELRALEKNHPTFHYVPTLSRSPETWEGAKGYIQDVLFSGMVPQQTGLEITPENFEVFLCGNPAMIEAAIGRLEEKEFVLAKGKKPGTIHIEEYW